MDRTKEYYTNLPAASPSDPQYKEKFYDTLTTKIKKLHSSLPNTRNYSQLLLLEEEAVALSNDPLLKLEIDANPNERQHFDGIKQIIKIKVGQLLLSLQRKKKTFLSYSYELEPEKPTKFVEINNVSYEYENKELKEKYESSAVTVTKERLKEIDVLQSIIKNCLLEQDERIDEVVKVTKDVKVNYKGSNDYFMKSKNNGRRMRRFLLVSLFCEAFVLLIVYFYHK